MIKDLSDRWIVQPQLASALATLLRLDGIADKAELERLGNSLSQVSHPLLESAADFRGIQLEGHMLGECWFRFTHDESRCIGVRFVETMFQLASFQRSVFSRCEFQRAQMSPVVMTGSQFLECRFESSFLMGYRDGPSEESSLRDCLFRDTSFTKTALVRSRLSGSRFERVRFMRCDFYRADLTGVDLSSTTFESCDLSGAIIDATAANEAVVNAGGNENPEHIRWRKPSTPVF